MTSGRHYFETGGVLLACWDALADGDPAFPGPNPGHVYLATDEPAAVSLPGGEFTRRRGPGPAGR